MDTTHLDTDLIRPHSGLNCLPSASKLGLLTGRGRILMTARLMLRMAANWNRLAMSDLATSAPAATIATGPDSDSLLFSKLVTTCCKPAVQRLLLSTSSLIGRHRMYHNGQNAAMCRSACRVSAARKAGLPKGLQATMVMAALQHICKCACTALTSAQ
jgi:hypothetical protein